MRVAPQRQVTVLRIDPPLFERLILFPFASSLEPCLKRVNCVDPSCTFQFYVVFNDVTYNEVMIGGKCAEIAVAYLRYPTCNL